MIYSRNHAREGFTLIEIVIAIAIVGFMMAAAVIGIPALRRMGQRNSVKSSLKTIQTALETYNLNVGSYPKELKELIEKPTDPKIATRWPGKLLNSLPEDPWNQPFHYEFTPRKEHPYELYSEGDPTDTEGAKYSVWDF